MSTTEPAISTVLGSIQLALHHDRVRGWLLYDLRGRSAVAARLLGAPGARLASEHRFFYWIPAEGLPVAIVHDDDVAALPELPGDRARYRTAYELRAALEAHVPREGIVLVEHAPFAQIADLAMLDEATLSLLRGKGTQVRSSIELANRFAGPLTDVEREEVRAVAGELASVRTMLARSVGAQPPETWDGLWDRVVAHATARGLVLASESGLAIDAAQRGQRATTRDGGPLAAGSSGRVDLWASRASHGSHVLVPASFEVSIGPVVEARGTLVPLLIECEDEVLRLLEERATRGRLLGSEVAELVHGALRRRGLHFAGSCVGWPLGPVARGTHACTFDAEGFADPRELVPGTVWALRLGVELGQAIAWRTSLVERIEGGLVTIARGSDAHLVVPAPA